MGLHVAERVAVEGRVCGRRVEVTRLDGRDPRVGRQASDVLDDVRPVFAAVARDLHITVIGSGPDDFAVLGRFGDGVNGFVFFRVGVVDGQTAGKFLMLAVGIVGGEVGAIGAACVGDLVAEQPK